MRRPHLLLLVLLAALAATGARAGQVIGRDAEGGGPPPPCETNCNNRQKPDVGVNEVTVSCDKGPGQQGNVNFFACYFYEFDGGTPDISLILDDDEPTGFLFDSPEPDCLAFHEGLSEIGTIQLELPVANKVAKIMKFIENPVGLGVDYDDAAVYIELNSRSFTVPISPFMNTQTLNNAVWAQIRTRFSISDYTDYWIVNFEKLTNASITWVSVRADVPTLVTSGAELRPHNSSYDTPCGYPGY